MPKKVSDTEIKHRLQQLRNVTMLHARAMARVTKLESIIAGLRAQLLRKEARITELETKLLDKEAQRKELASKLWKAKKDRAKAAITRDLARASGAPLRNPGAQPGHESHTRPTPPESEVTDRAVYDLSACPACKHTVGVVVDKVEKYQEDIDLAPRNKIVRHYTITRHWCGHCQEYVRPVNTPAQHLRRFGPNVVGYILYTRYRLRLPLLKIQESLSDLHDFTMSVGEIQHQLDEARESFGEQYALICELIRSARVVYADESGWRMDGDNWYIWAFVDKESGAVRYELVDTRGGDTARDALGGKEDQVIVSDGYSVYNSMDSANQQCWVHLLRVAKSKSVVVYGQLCKLYTQLLLELEKPVEQRDKQWFDEQLTGIQTKAYGKRKTDELLAPEVQARTARHHDQLLVCLDYDNVLPENNTAERAIRPQVIMRKIFGGNRSPTGAKTHAVNTSVIATKLKQNPDRSFFEVMLPLIQEAQGKPKAQPATA
jgi:transposase